LGFTILKECAGKGFILDAYMHQAQHVHAHQSSSEMEDAVS